MRLLIVDDEAIVREWFTSSIKDLGTGYSLIGAACDGPQALEIVRHQAVDIAFIDIKMPGMSGFDLITLLKEIQPELVVVILSAFADFEYARKALSAGASDYIVKAEITKELLKTTIDQFTSESNILSTLSVNDQSSCETRPPITRLFDGEGPTVAKLAEVGIHGSRVVLFLIGLPETESDKRLPIEEIILQIADRLDLESVCSPVSHRTFLCLLVSRGRMHKSADEFALVFANRFLMQLQKNPEYEAVYIGIDTLFSDAEGIKQQLTRAGISLTESFLRKEPISLTSKEKNPAVGYLQQ